MAEIASAPYQGYKAYKVFHKGMQRHFAVLVSPDHRTTISYGKYVLETSLGRKLRVGYEAHHKDEDKLNDAIGNLEEKPRAIHQKEHRDANSQRFVTLDCPSCGKEFKVAYRQTHWAKKTGNKTCCSRSCGRRAVLISVSQVMKRDEMVSVKERSASAAGRRLLS